MMEQDIQIVTAELPHYPSLCLIFLRNCDPLEDLAKDVLVGNILSTTLGSEEGSAAFQHITTHFGRLFKNIGYPLKQMSWAALGTALPNQRAKQFCSGRIHSLSEEFANARATYLSGLLHPAVVAKALPPSLKTEHAAAYMHHRQRYGLKTVIETALDIAG